MERKSRGTVTMSIEEYEYLKEASGLFRQFVKSDKCLEVNELSWCTRVDRRYIINPTPDLKNFADELSKEFQREKEKLLSKGHRRIRIWDVGKTIYNLL